MIQEIGTIVSPYKEKFGIPRQPHLVSELAAKVEVPFSCCAPDAFDGLQDFNFIWLLCLFHQAKTKSSKVRPPRLGGNKRLGVFATRSPFRPNPLALSLVKLVRIEFNHQRRVNVLHVQGIDLVDGTPVLDIKPYITEHDTPWESVRMGWNVEEPLVPLEVKWSENVLEQLAHLDQGKELKTKIEEVLRWDPRPAFHSDDANRLYHCRLESYDIHFSVFGTQVNIQKIDV